MSCSTCAEFEKSANHLGFVSHQAGILSARFCRKQCRCVLCSSDSLDIASTFLLLAHSLPVKIVTSESPCGCVMCKSVLQRASNLRAISNAHDALNSTASASLEGIGCAECARIRESIPYLSFIMHKLAIWLQRLNVESCSCSVCSLPMLRESNAPIFLAHNLVNVMGSFTGKDKFEMCSCDFCEQLRVSDTFLLTSSVLRVKDEIYTDVDTKAVLQPQKFSFSVDAIKAKRKGNQRQPLNVEPVVKQDDKRTLHFARKPLKVKSEQAEKDDLKALHCHKKVKKEFDFVADFGVKLKTECEDDCGSVEILENETGDFDDVLSGFEHIEVYQCDECSVIFWNASDLDLHVARQHIVLFYCDSCDVKFNTSKALENHEQSVHQRMFVCPECNKSFSTGFALNAHKMLHEDRPETELREIEKLDRPFMCEQCFRRFLTYRHLKRHTVSIHGEFVCRKCFTLFENAEQLNIHKVDFHFGESEMFQCLQCDFECLSTSGLRAHTVSVHEKSALCFVCGLGCSSPAHLRRHLNMTHGIRVSLSVNNEVYKCARCLFTVNQSQKDDLFLHIKNSHRNK